MLGVYEHRHQHAHNSQCVKVTSVIEMWRIGVLAHTRKSGEERGGGRRAEDKYYSGMISSAVILATTEGLNPSLLFTCSSF